MHLPTVVTLSLADCLASFPPAGSSSLFQALSTIIETLPNLPISAQTHTSEEMEDLEEQAFDLMRLAPELQIKIFEALPDLWTAAALRMTCRKLNALFIAYKKQIEAAIRDNLVAPFYEYYAFLGRLHILESAIKHPPPGGWPNITAESCSGVGKTDFAVDVLRHLPFIAEDGRQNFHNIEYKSDVVDYSKDTRERLRDSEVHFGLMIKYGSKSPVVEQTLVIALGNEDGGMVLYFDTRSGVMYEEIVQIGNGVRLPVREYFEYKMKQCRNLRQVFVPGEDAYGGGFYEDEVPYDAAAMEKAGEPSQPDEWFDLEHQTDLDWVRHLYRKFGWPGKAWRKEEGLKAIAEYAERRNTEAERWEEEEERRRHEAERRHAEAMAEAIFIATGSRKGR